MIYLVLGIALFAIDVILIKKMKKSLLKKILIPILIILTLFLLIYGTKNHGNCCECRDCKECDVCCDCSYPYLNR
jgi:hypothetical protein